MNNEDDVNDRLFELMAGAWTADRVENDRNLLPGHPDIVYSCRGTGFIESKFIKDTHSSTVKIGLRREQAAFMQRHAEFGARCFVAVGVGGASERLYLFDGADGRLLEPLPVLEFLMRGRLVSHPDDLRKTLNGALPL